MERWTLLRRDFLKAGLVAGGIGTAAAFGGFKAAESLLPKPKKPPFLSEINDPEVKKQLSESGMVAVAHGANTIEALEQSVLANSDYVEIDVQIVRWQGRDFFVVSHHFFWQEWIINNQFPFAHRPGEIVLLEEFVVLAAKKRQRLIFDSKAIGRNGLKEIAKLAQTPGLEGSIISRSFDLGPLDALRQTVSLIGVKTQKALDYILDRLGEGEISLEAGLATPPNLAKLQKARIRVFVYSDGDEMDNPYQVVSLVGREEAQGVVKGVISRNLGIIGAIKHASV